MENSKDFESKRQIDISATWSGLLEALKSDNLSEREKKALIFAWYMNSQLQQHE